MKNFTTTQPQTPTSEVLTGSTGESVRSGNERLERHVELVDHANALLDVFSRMTGSTTAREVTLVPVVESLQ